MATNALPDAPETPPHEWRRAWDLRLAAAAPERLQTGAGQSTAYWASGDRSVLFARLRQFGAWPAVAADALLLLAAEIVVNLLFSVVALFIIVLNGRYLVRYHDVNGALSHAQNALIDWLSSPQGLALGALATQAGIVLILYLRVVWRGLLRWADLGFGAALRRRPGSAIALGIGLGLLAFAVGEALLNVMHLLGLDVQEQANNFKSIRHAAAIAVVPFVLTTAITAPLAEESFFRGYLLRALSVRHGLTVGLIGSSALFAALHLVGGVGWVVVPLFVIGIILGWGYARTGNLATSVTAHAVNNLISTVLLLHGAN